MAAAMVSTLAVMTVGKTADLKVHPWAASMEKLKVSLLDLLMED